MSTLTRHELLVLIEEIDSVGEGLTPWEVNFIAGFVDKQPSSFSSKQADIIQRIHRERVLGEATR
jgi:hypothetical protein